MSVIEDHLKRMNEINAKASATTCEVASQMPKIVERYLPDGHGVKELLETAQGEAEPKKVR